MNYYIISQDKTISNSIMLDELPASINKRAVLLSEFQHIDKSSVEIKLANSSGEFRPDVCDYLIPLFSDRLKCLLDKNAIDSIMYKPVYLVCDKTMRKDLYWLSMVFPINCIDWKNSEKEGDLSLPKLMKFSIKDGCIGRFKIFKIGRVQNQLIVVTEDLYEVLQKQELHGVKFINTKDYEAI